MPKLAKEGKFEKTKVFHIYLILQSRHSKFALPFWSSFFALFDAQNLTIKWVIHSCVVLLPVEISHSLCGRKIQKFCLISLKISQVFSQQLLTKNVINKNGCQNLIHVEEKSWWGNSCWKQYVRHLLRQLIDTALPESS